MSSHTRFQWLQSHSNALEELKNSLKNLPKLTFPDETPSGGRYILCVDASDKAVGGTLSQVSTTDGTERFLGAFGRTLRHNEVKFHLTKRKSWHL